MTVPLSEVPGPTHRLIPSRFPPVSAFEDVASPDDLEAVMELEGWTNDRLLAERLARLPRSEWVFGTPNASVVMAAFLHGAPAGNRFCSADLGGWYAALSERTALAEIAHHLRREAVATGLPEIRSDLRCYTARIAGPCIDLRGLAPARPDLYAPDGYAASQSFGEGVRAASGTGILYDSVRHRGGVNVVVYRPRAILEVTVASHFDVIVPVTGAIVARRLS